MTLSPPPQRGRPGSQEGDSQPRIYGYLNRVHVKPAARWFSCAARGTGIAAALALADEFGRNQPILLASSGGGVINSCGVGEHLRTHPTRLLICGDRLSDRCT